MKTRIKVVELHSKEKIFIPQFRECFIWWAFPCGDSSWSFYDLGDAQRFIDGRLSSRKTKKYYIDYPATMEKL
jgi:hypothetical protein